MRPWRARWKATRAASRARWRAWRVASQNRAIARECFYCGVHFAPAGPDHRTVDHRMPRSRGGTDSLRNLVFACYACNQRKRDRSEEDFLASEWLQHRRRDVEARSVTPPAARRRRLNGGRSG
jgi:5-methylcytosine-specific restriction endonuclease McrA